MPEYALVRIRRDTKQEIEEMKPDGVAWHVMMDVLYKSYIEDMGDVVAEDPETWLHELFGERADE
jgi:hypothetical protein